MAKWTKYVQIKGNIRATPMSIRKRIENSALLAGFLASILAIYVRFCFSTTRWQVQGLEELSKALDDGPVIYVLWHSRVMYGPSAWPADLGRLFTLMDPSPIGQVAARTQARLGMEPISMSARKSNFGASRQILKTIRAGHSVGIAADGPEGPNRDAKQASIEWARATGRPVFLFSWRAEKGRRLKTWDRMILPRPFTRGVYGFRKWDVDVPRKLDEAGYRELRASLSGALDQITSDTDISAGVQPDI